MDHEAISFADNVNHMVEATNLPSANGYIQQFHDVLIAFYAMNGLIMNKAKTMMLLFSLGKHDHISVSIGVKPDGTPIKILDEKQIKILGFWTNRSNKIKSHLYKLNANVSNSIKLMSHVLPKININKRKQLLMSKVTYQVDYGAALYIGQTDDIKRKVNTIRMKCYTVILRENMYMVRHKTI